MSELQEWHERFDRKGLLKAGSWDLGYVANPGRYDSEDRVLKVGCNLSQDTHRHVPRINMRFAKGEIEPGVRIGIVGCAKNEKGRCNIPESGGRCIQEIPGRRVLPPDLFRSTVLAIREENRPVLRQLGFELEDFKPSDPLEIVDLSLDDVVGLPTDELKKIVTQRIADVSEQAVADRLVKLGSNCPDGRHILKIIYQNTVANSEISKLPPELQALIDRFHLRPGHSEKGVLEWLLRVGPSKLATLQKS